MLLLNRVKQYNYCIYKRLTQMDVKSYQLRFQFMNYVRYDTGQYQNQIPEGAYQ